MKVKKLLDFVNKNYIYFSELEIETLFGFDINKFFLSVFTKINSQKNNKKLVRIWVKLYEFKELYKKYPCEFNFTFCEDEKN